MLLFCVSTWMAQRDPYQQLIDLREHLQLQEYLIFRYRLSHIVILCHLVLSFKMWLGFSNFSLTL